MDHGSKVNISVGNGFLHLVSIPLLLTRSFRVPDHDYFQEHRRTLRSFHPYHLLPLLRIPSEAVTPDRQVNRFLLRHFCVNEGLSLPFVLLPLLGLQLQENLYGQCEYLRRYSSAVYSGPFRSLMSFVEFLSSYLWS